MQISNIDNSQIFCKQTRETNTKMSTNVDFEIARDKDGFLKCEDCQRRFLTKIGFENHSYNHFTFDFVNFNQYDNESIWSS